MSNEIIYLDKEFVIQEYENATGETPHIKYSKSKDVSAGLE